jgi:hypothetical protein
MSIALHMMEVRVLVLVLVLVLVPVPIRVREEGLNCADVVVVVVAADALTEEVAVEANGCLFDVTVMSNKIRVYRSRNVVAVVVVAVDKMRSILSALLVLISLLRILNLLHLHLFQQRHQLLLLKNRKQVVLGMCLQPLVLLQRRRLVRLSLQFK